MIEIDRLHSAIVYLAPREHTGGKALSTTVV
jgi:hypothetical protein